MFEGDSSVVCVVEVIVICLCSALIIRLDCLDPSSSRFNQPQMGQVWLHRSRHSKSNALRSTCGVTYLYDLLWCMRCAAFMSQNLSNSRRWRGSSQLRCFSIASIRRPGLQDYTACVSKRLPRPPSPKSPCVIQEKSIFV